MTTKKLFLSLVVLLVTLSGSAQTKDEIQKKQQDLQQELADLNKTYNEIKQNKKISLGQLAVVQRKIRAREELISTLNKDLRRIDDDIYLTTLEMNRMRRELDTLKQNYAQSLVFAYKNRSNYDYLNFIFSATSFNDAVKRVEYLRSYRQFRATQVDNIVKTQQVLQEKSSYLSSSKTNKNSALKEQGAQMIGLEEEKKEKDQVVQELKGRESEISAQIKEREVSRQRLKKALDQAIRREREALIREAKKREEQAKIAREKAAEEDRKRKAALAAKEEQDRKAAVAAANVNKEKEKENATAAAQPPRTNPAPTPSSTTTPPKKDEPATGMVGIGNKNREVSIFETTPEGLERSLNFEHNKGHLPWPADAGYVSTHFGPYTIPNTPLHGVSDGIVITMSKGASVKAVADGEVSTIADFGDGQAVIVIHGKYFTTYSNLGSVSVSKGDKVKAGTLLGKVAAGDDGEGQLTFMVTNDKGNLLNPEQWLKRK
ncbi:Septal ring factor EnvC, activator of murein hydrolases AmiA and AmiB [Filimonas lacunae]|uniref:Septal ring factor EnvC, activator of murein hydrolases AmiA and AmiB n=1 Tax=Filimonas lacunae TaxID=477680 RepID=A0A173MRK2_9BACT|nr:peptidoglycan DD-metalloendopeptidase family protein [Filimonas lacunae]BAV10283.1 periplasmic septal ring factor with murein hydrolase activity EnvC/YibP [Filimonas lacunae]SIT17504.1 Septal ring factor EnvC, activator of murein hydrolases AmiA and AmiB [Filimonas lacunae]